VWALALEEISDYATNLQEPHARAWLASVFKDLSKEEATRVVVHLWALWYARRKIIHEGEYQSPLSTHYFVERFLSDLNVTEHVPPLGKGMEAQGLEWIAPPAGLVKINVDAVVTKNTGHDAMAAVPRSMEGVFLGALVVVT
jgi:hypothetical protein